VQNDEMNVSMFVEINDADPARLSQRLNNIANEALQIAKAQKNVKARTGTNRSYPVYDRNNKLTGWRGRSEIRLDSKDFAAVSSLIGKLQSSMQLENVSFEVSPELRRQTQNELMTEVVAAFRQRAQVLQQALGGTSYKLRRMSVNTSGGVVSPMPMTMRAKASEAYAAAPTFEGGSSQIQVSASGTIEVR
jgi:predicted secreted protein